MVKKLLSILSLFVAVFFLTACSSDELSSANDEFTTVAVPVELCAGQSLTQASRGVGDPGYDDSLLPPTNIYAWAYAKTKDGKYSVEFRYLSVEKTDWGFNGVEDANSIYTLPERLSFTFANLSTDAAPIGKIYVVATEKQLSAEDLNGMCNIFTAENYAGLITTATGVENIKEQETSPKETLEAMVLNTSSWSSKELRDLYSNPLGDTKQDTENGNLLNGEIMKSGKKTMVGRIRLYHCAAKVDFKWEVADALRPATSVASITCTGLPTTLKVFAPTKNPAKKFDGTTDNTDGSCLVLGTDASAVNALTLANQYIGRAYAYVLQPASGTVNYKVTFNGRAEKSATTESAPASIFTTWYRVVAEVKP